MNLFSKQKQNTEDLEDYSTLSLPFSDTQEEKVAISEPETTVNNTSEKNDIKLYPGGVSPLDSLKKKINEEVPKTDLTDSAKAAPAEAFFERQEGPLSGDREVNKAEKPVSLLKRCLPYIYDDEGVSQLDNKPNYVLESVDDIIRSAEKRASEKIAEKYKLTDKQGNPIRLQSVESSMPQNEELPKPAEMASPVLESSEKISLPKNADVLFDDFSGKRTVVTPTESITTTYSKLNELHSTIPITATASTIVMPSLKTAKSDTMENILSHTRPVNIKDAPAIKPQKPIAVAVKTDDLLPEVPDDYKTSADAKRVGFGLKKARRSAFFKAILSLLCTIASAVFVLVLPDSLFDRVPFVPCIVQLSLLCICSFANINIFSSFKTMFTRSTAASAPIALSVTLTAIYSVFGLIIGTYPADPVLLTLISFCGYDVCLYMRKTSILNSFKIVAAKTEKKAIALIDEQNTTSSMARSSIEGEVLATGVRRAATLTDFLKFSSADSAFGGFIGTALSVFAVLGLVSSVIIGVSHHSLQSALGTAAIMLSIFAMPTYSVAEFAPLNSLSKRLYKLKAMICSKYSASRIEQANAVVITSSELFPSGSMELFNIKPLGANNIDRTLSNAASVAEAIGSPLISVFNSFVDPSEKRIAADTVKYEDNLGISGWVGDTHYFIGNRTLMEAHGIKVPSLEVDRKILHKGYFPIYVAAGQRACALMIVKYNPVISVKNHLVKLANSGMTLLIDNCDSNITADMLSDYYGIYKDSIKIMDHKGVQNYRSAVKFTELYSAHAAFIGRSDGYFAIINGALRLGRVSRLMYALHIILAALFCTVFTLAGLDGRMALMEIAICTLIEIICLVVSVIAFAISKR